MHERALSIVHQDKKSNLQDLLQKGKCVSVHMGNLQYLATHIYNLKNVLSSEIMKQVFVFQENENYDLRCGTHLANRNMHTAHIGTDTITNLRPKLYRAKQKKCFTIISSNLSLKYGPLITALVHSVKLLLKTFVLLKSVQISNGLLYFL